MEHENNGWAGPCQILAGRQLAEFAFQCGFLSSLLAAKTAVGRGLWGLDERLLASAAGAGTSKKPSAGARSARGVARRGSVRRDPTRRAALRAAPETRPHPARSPIPAQPAGSKKHLLLAKMQGEGK